MSLNISYHNYFSICDQEAEFQFSLFIEVNVFKYIKRHCIPTSNVLPNVNQTI